MTTKTLYVRNIEQAAAWLELDGQLSDGFWENARPYDHWRAWSGVDVKVAERGQMLGTDFFPGRDRYDFSAKELLDVVGFRMLGIVRIARSLGLRSAAILEHEVSTDAPLGRPTVPNAGRNPDILAKLEAIGVDYDSVDIALANESYTMTDLRRDLNDLKKIIKMRVPLVNIGVQGGL